MYKVCVEDNSDENSYESESVLEESGEEEQEAWERVRTAGYEE